MAKEVLPEAHGYVQVLPWSSKRLTSTHLSNIAKAMGLQIPPEEDICLMIEGRLAEMGKDPGYTQVGLVVKGKIDLLDAEGVFFSATIEKYKESDLAGERGYHEESSVIQQAQQLSEVTAQNLKLSTKVCDLEAELEAQRNRNQVLWKMNCNQLKVYDSELTFKDAEIAKVMSRLDTGGKNNANTAGSVLVSANPAHAVDAEGVAVSTNQVHGVGTDGIAVSTNPAHGVGTDGVAISTNPAHGIGTDGVAVSTNPAHRIGTDGVAVSTNPAHKASTDGVTVYTNPAHGIAVSTNSAYGVGTDGTADMNPLYEDLPVDTAVVVEEPPTILQQNILGKTGMIYGVITSIFVIICLCPWALICSTSGIVLGRDSIDAGQSGDKKMAKVYGFLSHHCTSLGWVSAIVGAGFVILVVVRL